MCVDDKGKAKIVTFIIISADDIYIHNLEQEVKFTSAEPSAM
jgi:hypothetical protein